MENSLKNLHEAVRRGVAASNNLSKNGIDVDWPDFDYFFERKVKKILGAPTDENSAAYSWEELVTKYGDPGDVDFLSKDVFCAWVATNNWLKDISDYVTDYFEETVCEAFCLMWRYLYDRFGSIAMEVFGDLNDDEAAQFYDDELSES